VRFTALWSQNASKYRKTLSFTLVFVPILTYGHDSWVMTERIQSQVQVAEMGILRGVHDVTYRDKVHSCEIRKDLNIKPLLLRTDRFQLRGFGRVKKSQE